MHRPVFRSTSETGQIDPATIDNIPGLEALRTRRPDGPVRALARTARRADEGDRRLHQVRPAHRRPADLHASVQLLKHRDSPYAKYSYNDKDFAGGYGRQVLGETWIAHYGAHRSESTRGIIAPGMEKHPILRGVQDIWGESDVYEITTLSGDSQPLVMGQVLMGMDPTSPPNTDKAADAGRVDQDLYRRFGQARARLHAPPWATPMDFSNEGFRRMIVNACYWAMGLEKKIPAKSNVEFVGKYKPNPIGLRGEKKGLKPYDFK